MFSIQGCATKFAFCFFKKKSVLGILKTLILPVCVPRLQAGNRVACVRCSRRRGLENLENKLPENAAKGPFPEFPVCGATGTCFTHRALPWGVPAPPCSLVPPHSHQPHAGASPCSQWWLLVESWWEGGAGPQASPSFALPGSQRNKRSGKRRLRRSLLRPGQEGGSLGPMSCRLYQNVKIKGPVLRTRLCSACSARPPSLRDLMLARPRNLPPSVHAQLWGFTDSPLSTSPMVERLGGQKRPWLTPPTAVSPREPCVLGRARPVLPLGGQPLPPLLKENCNVNKRLKLPPQRVVEKSKPRERPQCPGKLP